MDLNKIEHELKKRLSIPYSWGKKQSDDWDTRTNFIYQIESFDQLVQKIKNEFKEEKNSKSLANYALNRWYNFWSAMAVEDIFCSMKGVAPAKNSRDKLVDFRINKINFDHKTSVYPEGYNTDLYFALRNEKDLIKWLYKKQSSEGRQHFKNRLFVLLYDSNGDHWKLKSEISWLKNIIENYVSSFDVNDLHVFEFKAGEKTLSDIIWGIK